MNHQNWKSLERVIERLEKRQKRSGRRVTTSSLALVGGLFLGFLLLSRLIPAVWPALLAAEPEQALRGWPLLVWRAALVCVQYDQAFLTGLVVASLLILVLSYRVGALRPIFWLAALGVVLIDAGILASTLLACYDIVQQSI